MSLVAKRDIQPGEEIFTSYNYDVQKAPIWYQVNFIFLTVPNIKDRKIFTVLQFYMLSGAVVPACAAGSQLDRTGTFFINYLKKMNYVLFFKFSTGKKDILAFFRKRFTL
jgi:hypothetical protein